MLWILLFCVIAMVAIFLCARPATIHDSDYKGRYVIVNRYTGYPALHGRHFRTEKAAIRALRRYFWLDRMFHRNSFLFWPADAFVVYRYL